MFKRHIKPLLEKAINRAPVILLNGARQVGKTTLAKEFLAQKNYHFVTFDDELAFLEAKSSPSAFIQQLPKPVILDEVQRIPEIFLAIKRDVDENRIFGRYLLTGSANPLLLPRMGDSLAGRMEVIDMMPLSQGEINDTPDLFVDLMFSEMPFVAPQNSMTKENLYTRIITGGYPAVQDRSNDDREIWLRNYVNLILQRDVKDLANIEKITEFPNLLKILAAQASGLLNVAELARETKINVKTLHRYLALLKTIFIVDLQPAWNSNRGIRFMKSPKLYLVDSGLMAHLLDFTVERALNDSYMIGNMLENFVVNELKKQATWAKKYVQFYHFRTLAGTEVDIVCESQAGSIVGIEVKNSSYVDRGDFAGLRYLQEKTKNKFARGIVLYTGSQSLRFEDKLWAVPIQSLWEAK